MDRGACRLPSMGLQRIGQDLVTKHQQQMGRITIERLNSGLSITIERLNSGLKTSQ